VEAAETARQRTLGRLPDLGFPAPPEHLPLLADDDEPFVPRRQSEVVERLLVLNVRVNLAFGMPADTARAWLTANQLTHCLSEVEIELVRRTASVDSVEQTLVEAMWALAWALNLTPQLDPSAYCGDDLVTLVPDLRTSESVAGWLSRRSPELRESDDLLAELDLLYAMTWGVVDARLNGRDRPGVLEEYVHWERRKALEFARASHEVSHASWDAIDLST
jgi:hypothetical protein